MKKLVFALSVSILLSACSAKVKGTTLPNFGFDKPAIDGPADIVGTWASGCVGYHKTTLTLGSDNSFSYERADFNDSACVSLNISEKHSGTYQFSEKLTEEVYAIDYQYVENHTTYTLPNQRLQKTGGTVYISPMNWFDNTVDVGTPLTKVN